MGREALGKKKETTLGRVSEVDEKTRPPVRLVSVLARNLTMPAFTTLVLYMARSPETRHIQHQKRCILHVSSRIPISDVGLS